MICSYCGYNDFFNHKLMYPSIDIPIYVCNNYNCRCNFRENREKIKENFDTLIMEFVDDFTVYYNISKAISVFIGDKKKGGAVSE